VPVKTPSKPFKCKTVGLSYRKNYPQNILDLQNTPEKLTLRRDALNEHDAQAIQVLAGPGLLGYLPRNVSSWLAVAMDQGQRVSVVSWEVLIAPGKRSQPGLMLLITAAS